MPPRMLAHVLGLCNLVAGALLVSAPAFLIGRLEGSHTASARLLGMGTGVLLIAIGVGAWRTPPGALRSYLWIFGVAVKLAGGLLWSLTAHEAGVNGLYVGAAADGMAALVIASGLWRSGERP